MASGCFLALSYVVRDRLLHRWVRSARTYLEGKHRTVIYLSAEYLMGPQLANTRVGRTWTGPEDHYKWAPRSRM